MKKFEITTAILSIIALVAYYFLHIRGAAILTFIFLMKYALLYSPLGFAVLNNIRFRDILKKDAYKEISVQRILGAIFTGWALSVIISGMLFKFLFLPGAGFMLIAGLCYLPIIAIVAIVKYVKTRSQFYVGILTRIAIIGGVGLFLFFLPSSTLKDIKYRNHPEKRVEERNRLYPDEMQNNYQEE